MYPAGREETTSAEMTEGEKWPLEADIVGAEKIGKRRELTGWVGVPIQEVGSWNAATPPEKTDPSEDQ